MKEKHKAYLRLNLLSLFFIAVSFISVTMAWFAYSGLTDVSTEIGVKAWYIKFDGGETDESNNIVISLNNIYPGMETVSEKVIVNNKGDSDAQISYSIASARILDDEFSSENFLDGFLEDQLSHVYPFHINISLSKNYIEAKEGTSEFIVSVSWPLDSGDDILDGTWGSKAYQFQDNEAKLEGEGTGYVARPALKIAINLKALQHVEGNNSADFEYNLGDPVLFNISKNAKCTAIGGDCIKMYVIDQKHIFDENNVITDTEISLLPDLFNSYTSTTYARYNSFLSSLTGGWKVTTRALTVKDLLKVLSHDALNSFVIRPGLSDRILGYMNYGDRAATDIAETVAIGGHYQFLNSQFPFLVTSKCYWISDQYDTKNGFALMKTDETYSKIYGQLKSSTCDIVPVVVTTKSILNSSTS